MIGKSRFVLALCGLFGILGAVTALLYLILWTDLRLDERQEVLQILQGRMGAVIFILLLSMVALGMVFHALYRRYVTAPLKLREALLIRLGTDSETTVRPEGSPELRALAGTVNQLLEQRDALRLDVQQRINEAKQLVEDEKNRFAALIAALISDLNQCVLVCNVDGRIVLYNDRARMLFQQQGMPASAANIARIGLGRSIFSVLERSLIEHALEQIEDTLSSGSPQMVASFVTGIPPDQLVRTRMAPVFTSSRDSKHTVSAGDGRKFNVSGYVLVLDNITESVDIESRRNSLLQALTEGSRSSLGSIRAAVDNMLDYPDMGSDQRDRFLHVAGDEVHAMSQRLDRTTAEFSDVLKGHWPMEDMLGADLIHAARRRIEQRLGLLTKTEELATGIWLKVDSFSLLQALTYIASRLKEEFSVREVRFGLGREGRLVHLDLIWTGVVIGTETLMNWELDPMHGGAAGSSLTLREVIERHGGELWLQRDKFTHRAFFRILIPASATPLIRASTTAPGANRPEHYDFDLFRQAGAARALDERLLTELAFTVFDTETTGLDPAGGDEIIQIGATRILNGRLLKDESFEQLVDPQRPIPAASRKIHGIGDDMVAGQPSIERVLPAFHAFCGDSVLVAHNAAFDMRFLQLKEAATGTVFDHPVLDTLQLSAVVHPHQDSHSLEAIAARFGIAITDRHTALADATVAAEVFLKMIPLLEEKGIRTLGDARAAAQKTYYAKVRY